MIRFRITTIALILGLAACQLPPQETRDADGMLLPGSPCPDFQVVDSDGAVVTQEDLAGRRTVLWFYPKAATPG